MKKTIPYILALLVLAAVPAVQAQTLRMGYVEFEPVTYTDSQGKPAGLLMDASAKIIEKAGYDWTAQSLPAKRMARMVAKGHIHLFVGLSTLPEFKGTTLVSQSVVTQLKMRAYYLGEKPPIRKKQDLLDKTLLIQRGYSYGGWVNFIREPANKIRYVAFDSHETAFRRLAHFSNKMANCYLLDYKHPSETALKVIKMKDIRFNEISALDIRFVVTLKMKAPEIVLERLEAAFRELSGAGELDDLF